MEVSCGEQGQRQYKNIKPELKQFLSKTIDQVIADVKGEIDGMKRVRKPTHGACCTCQECGGTIENCDCERNRILDDALQNIDKKFNEKDHDVSYGIVDN